MGDLCGLGLEIAAMELPGLPDRLRAALLMAAYPILAVFLVANRRLPGMALVALGGAMNPLAISLNGGIMPASPAALAGAGLAVHPPGFHNSAALARPRLAFLGDVFFIPASWPLSNVFSVGDVLIGLGWPGRCTVSAAPAWPPPGGRARASGTGGGQAGLTEGSPLAL